MTTAKKSSAKKSPAKTAKKSAAKKTATKSAAKKTATKGSAKKESLVKEKRSTGSGPACWPGFEHVPGKEPGTKGSCKPKPNQTAGEKKGDARAAAGSKQRKGAKS